MTSQGSPYGRFSKALRARSLFHAELAARELGKLNLDDALELTILIAEEDPSRLERAALRWHGRFELEAPNVTLAESQVLLAALRVLEGPAPARAAEVLRLFGHGRRLTTT